jgi:formyl-CoA transferase
MMESTVPEYSEGGFIRERTGSILPGVAPSNVYPCADGDILIGANQNSVFARLAEAMGQPELSTDPRYATHNARGENQAELDDLISDWTRTRKARRRAATMEDHGVPAGKIYKAPDMLADPHFAAREALVKVAHPQFRNLVMQNVFPKLSATPGKVNWPGQPMGAQNHEIYKELLGLSDDDLPACARTA